MTVQSQSKQGRAGGDPACVECVLAWLLLGDGAECLAGHGRVYWKGTSHA